MKIAYRPWKPGADARAVVADAERIAADYRQQGYDLTLRQLYYQFVARGLIPNTDRSYQRLGSIVNRARMGGLLDWSYIVDRTRNIAGVGYYPTAADLLEGVAEHFTVDHWQDQPAYIEVWVEKEALAGVVSRAARRFDVPYFSCRGYVSQSELWGAAQRLREQIEQGHHVLVLHLGDHDPSGIDMTRDIRDRLDTFICTDWAREFIVDDEPTFEDVFDDMRALLIDGDREPLEVRRIALNMEQVVEYDPPPNPAKMTDSRVGNYISAYGNESWELDALDPATLNALITEHIEAEIDTDLWAAHDDEQDVERSRLRRLIARYDEDDAS